MNRMTTSKYLVHFIFRNLKKAEDKVTSVQEEIEENKNKISELDTLFKTLEDEATQVLESYQQSQVSLQSYQQSQQSLKYYQKFQVNLRSKQIAPLLNSFPNKLL